MKKLTKEEFIGKSIMLFGDIFDFSDTIYENTKSKITYYCKPFGHIIHKKASTHLKNGICPECNEMVKTTEAFKRKAILKHSDKFNYDNTIFIKSTIKVEIFCNKHKIFFKTLPSNHLNYDGSCPECFKEKIKETQFPKYVQSEFVEKAIQIHGTELYDLSLVEYISSDKKIKIICNKHKIIFEIRPTTFLGGCGCYLCGRERISNFHKYDKEEFISKSKIIHGEVHYDYKDVNYLNSSENVKIFCNIHNEYFEIDPSSHIKTSRPSGCPKCGFERSKEKLTKPVDIFIKESRMIHGEEHYDYKDVNYVNNYTKIDLTCNKHSFKFQIKPTAHLQGSGCKFCSSSKGELAIKNYLSNNSIKFEPQFKFNDCKYINSLPFDFVVLNEDCSIKFLIEFQGQHHYFPVNFGGCCNDIAIKNHEYTLRNDSIKKEYCLKNSIPILYIRYDEFDRIEDILNSYFEI